MGSASASSGLILEGRFLPASLKSCPAAHMPSHTPQPNARDFLFIYLLYIVYLFIRMGSMWWNSYRNSIESNSVYAIPWSPAVWWWTKQKNSIKITFFHIQTWQTFFHSSELPRFTFAKIVPCLISAAGFRYSMLLNPVIRNFFYLFFFFIHHFGQFWSFWSTYHYLLKLLQIFMWIKRF